MIRIGLLGAGGMGNVHTRHYRNIPDVELLFWDHDPAKREAYQARWGGEAARDLSDLITRSDAIDVSLPTDLHVAMGHKAIEAGKGLFIEKPAAKTFEDAMGLYEAAEKAGVPYMVGQVARFFPEYSAAHDRVASGALGKIGVARMRRGGLAPTGSDSWFMDHKRSGGVLLDLGIHEFDWLRWTLGEVTSINSRSLGANTGTGPDYGLTVMSFESGAIAHVESTWMDPSGFRATFEICGSKGMVEFDTRQVQTLRTHVGGKVAQEAPLAAKDDPYFRELSAFAASVKNRTAPPITGLDGAMAVGLALSALQSAKEGRPITPPRP